MTSEEVWSRRDKEIPWIWYNDLYFIGPLVLVLSLLVGICFYIIYNGWTVGSATLCATATLIGAIYGVPNQPDNVGAAFTILYYIYGISLLTAIIGAIIGSMITRAPLISAKARRKIAQMEQPEDTDGDGEIGFYDYCFFLRERFLHWINWEENQTNYLVTAAATFWVWLGVMYGMYIEKWTFEHSLYFAMNAVSMAALADPPCEHGDGEHCDIGFYRGLAMSAYLLIGVPIFTLMLAQLAGLVINKAVRENEYKIISQPLTQEEYNYAANLYDNDEVLSLGEFTVLELLRLQRVSMEDLEHIKNLFCAIDEAATGMVDKPMLEKRNLIHPYGSTGATTAEGEGGGAAGEDNPRDGLGRSGSGSGRGRARSTSNASARSTRTRESSRTRSATGTLNRRITPPSLPGVLFDVQDDVIEGEAGQEEESEDREGHLTSSGRWRRDGGGGGDSQGSRGSSVAPEVPVGIKRMTIGQYNNLVVPLAFTTLIENYEEEEGGGENVSVDLSSKNISEGEEGDVDWYSDHALRSRETSSTNLHINGHLNLPGNLNGGGSGSGFKNLLSESEREDDEQVLIGRFAQSRANSIRRERRPPSRKKSRRRGDRSSRDRNLGDIEEGYES